MKPLKLKLCKFQVRDMSLMEFFIFLGAFWTTLYFKER